MNSKLFSCNSNFALKIYFLVILLLINISCSEKKESTEEGYFPKQVNHFAGLDFAKIESGDIIVKCGKGSLSRKIADRLNEKVRLSHCGVLVNENDSIYVIHSVAKELTGIDGVQEVDFETFKRDCLKGMLYVVRYRGSDEDKKQIAGTALNFLDRKAPFDYEINYDDSVKVNCSEFVYWTLRRASGKDLFKRIKIDDKYPLAFNSLLDTAYFEIIYRY